MRLLAFLSLFAGAEHVRTVLVKHNRYVDELLLALIIVGGRDQPLQPESIAVLALDRLKCQANIGALGRLWNVRITQADRRVLAEVANDLRYLALLTKIELVVISLFLFVLKRVVNYRLLRLLGLGEC